MTAQQATAAGGEAAVVDTAATTPVDPIEALADSFFDEEEQPDAPAGEGDEPELSAEDVPDEDEQAEPAIKPPVSWTDEEKAVFAELPAEAQKAVARREAEREKFVQSKAGEAQQARQHAEREAVAQVRTIAQQHAQMFQALLPQVHPKPSAAMMNEDQYAYAEHLAAHESSLAHYQAVEQALRGAQAQANQADQFLRQQEQQEIQTVLGDKFPEFLDQGESGQKLREKLGSTALALGFPAEALKDVNATEILAMKTATDWKAKADKYDALMAQKMEKVREAKNLPRLSRPGSAPTRAQAGAKAVEASWSRVKETKGRDREAAFGEWLGKAGLV